jgi:hypothetical protein
MKLNIIGWVALVLTVIGALNWGLVGLFQFNLVDAIFGEGSGLSRIIYILVGLSGVYLIAAVVAKCKGSEQQSETPQTEQQE